MTGHILANLAIQRQKLRQGYYYGKGAERGYLKDTFQQMLVEGNKLFDEINQVMLDEGEVVPTTTAEFQQYAMLQESGERKYFSSEALLADTLKDCDTQLLFVTRGIALATKEGKVALATKLGELFGWLKHQIYELQSFLGNDPTTGLDDDD